MAIDIWDELLKRDIKDPTDVEDLYTTPKQPETITNTILVKRRRYYIDKVKTPLARGIIGIINQGWIARIRTVFEIIKLIRKYPEPTKENTKYLNTHTTLDLVDEFFRLYTNKSRVLLFKAFYRLMSGTFEHDGHYSSIREWWIEKIIIAILNGKWNPRPSNWPLDKWWNEPAPYGGEHTIIARMIKHREEIMDILKRG